MEDLIAELVEEVFGSILNNNKIPKPIRYVFVVLIVGFITWIAIKIVLLSTAIIAKIIGILFTLFILMAGLFLLMRIFRS